MIKCSGADCEVKGNDNPHYLNREENCIVDHYSSKHKMVKQSYRRVDSYKALSFYSH